MSWGVQLAGFSALSRALDELINVQLGDDVVYVVGSNVTYSVHVELGTRYQSPQPYLFPSAREAERNIQSIAGNANSLAEAVKLVALFIERRAAERAPVDTGLLMNSIRSERVN